MPAAYIVSLLPDVKVFGRTHKYISVLSLMPNLQRANPGTFSEQKQWQNLDNQENTKQYTYALKKRKYAIHK